MTQNEALQYFRALQAIDDTWAALRCIAIVQEPVFDAVPADSPQQKYIGQLRDCVADMQQYLRTAVTQHPAGLQDQQPSFVGAAPQSVH